MNKTRLITIWFFAVAALMVLTEAAFASEDSNQPAIREYPIKAAFIYNFIKFTDWPEKKIADSNEPIILGIIGDDPFGDAFEPVKDKQVTGRKVLIERFKSFEEAEKSDTSNKIELQRKIEALRKCHLLFICSSEKDNLAEIIEALRGSSVLTVGEIPNFLVAGGIIKFLVEEDKIRFEINLDASDEAELKISSKLLRLAKRVMKEEDQFENADKKSKNTK